MEPQPTYLVDAPQEFDEPGKELDHDARVWKIYMKEANRIDKELADGWNKSMDLNLLLATLFSAIVTAFLIKGYENLKTSIPTVATGSPARMTLTSRTLSFELLQNTNLCANALWYTSLGISLLVTVVSILGKDWCSEFLSRRTGSYLVQARRRQQKWDGLISWKMQEVFAALPCMIHLSLFIFEIGLCFFLWDTHIALVLPMMVLTAFSVIIYSAFTILPLLYDHLPYSTALSRLYQQLFRLDPKATRTTSNTLVQDEVTGAAIHWMVMNCGNSRSIDVALQSLAAAEKEFPVDVLGICDAWTLIKRRLDSHPEPNGPERLLYERALESHTIAQKITDQLDYGADKEVSRLEQLVLSMQSCINSAIHSLLADGGLSKHHIRILKRCQLIGRHYLGEGPGRITEALHNDKYWQVSTYEYPIPVEPELLTEEIMQWLERHLTSNIEVKSTLHCVLSACLAFLLSCNLAHDSTSLPRNCLLRLVHAYLTQELLELKKRLGYYKRRLRKPSHMYGVFMEQAIRIQRQKKSQMISFHEMALGLLLGTQWALRSPMLPDEPSPPTGHMRAERILGIHWQYLVKALYSDASTFDTPIHQVQGGIHLLVNALDYELSWDDCVAIFDFIELAHDRYDRSTTSHRGYHHQFVKEITRVLPIGPDVTVFSPQLLKGCEALLDWSPDEYLVPTPEIYVFTLVSIFQAKHGEQEDAYECSCRLMATYPFPEATPRLIDMLSNSGIMAHLIKSVDGDDIELRAFALAQLWLICNMSLELVDGSDATRRILESMLLQYPALENDLANQWELRDELAYRLRALSKLTPWPSSDPSPRYVWYYALRILECTFQQVFAPVTEAAHAYLMWVPHGLRGIESSVNLELVGLDAPPGSEAQA